MAVDAASAGKFPEWSRYGVVDESMSQMSTVGEHSSKHQSKSECVGRSRNTAHSMSDSDRLPALRKAGKSLPRSPVFFSRRLPLGFGGDGVLAGDGSIHHGVCKGSPCLVMTGTAKQ